MRSRRIPFVIYSIYIYIFTYKCIYIHTYIQFIRTSEYIYSVIADEESKNAFADLFVGLYPRMMQVSIHVCMRVCMYECMYDLCMYVCMYVCI